MLERGAASLFPAVRVKPELFNDAVHQPVLPGVKQVGGRDTEDNEDKSLGSHKDHIGLKQK